MMRVRRCAWCKNGISMMDGDVPFTACALLPPAPIVTRDTRSPNVAEHAERLVWVRPQMAQRGWCGQFRLGILRLFGYGAAGA